VDPRAGLEVLEKRSISCPCRKIEPRIVQFVPSHYNDSVIPMNRGRNCDSKLPNVGSVFSLCDEATVIISTGHRSRILGLVGVKTPLFFPRPGV